MSVIGWVMSAINVIRLIGSIITTIPACEGGRQRSHELCLDQVTLFLLVNASGSNGIFKTKYLFQLAHQFPNIGVHMRGFGQNSKRIQLC